MNLGPYIPNTYVVGDCRSLLRALPDESIDCVVTSPPYWGLRSYLPADDPAKALELGCERTYLEYVANMVDVFREVRRVLKQDGTLWLNLGDCYATGAGAVGECPGGGAQGERWRGYRGERLANGRGDQPAILRVKTRATRDGSHAGKNAAIAGLGPMTQPNRLPNPGLKPKDLVGIPWRVAFGLQADGWWLRSEVIWHKPNPMPESVCDRPTKSHEQLFLLSKSERYFYDKDAVAEDSVSTEPSGNVFFGRQGGSDRSPQSGGAGSTEPWSPKRRPSDRANGSHVPGALNHSGFHREGSERDPAKRNKRSVWTIPTDPTPDAHFATFPRKLVEPCILAGCPNGGIVLDPFGGSGTVGRVAEDLGRKWLLFDLSAAYAEIAKRKTAQTGLLGLVAK